MFVGILPSNILPLLGRMFQPLLSRYKSEVLSKHIAKYRYILKPQAETSVEDVKKFAVPPLQ